MDYGLICGGLFFLCCAFFLGIFLWKPELKFKIQEFTSGTNSSTLVTDWGRFRIVHRILVLPAFVLSVILFFFFLDRGLHKEEYEAKAAREREEYEEVMRKLEEKRREEERKRMEEIFPSTGR